VETYPQQNTDIIILHPIASAPSICV